MAIKLETEKTQLAKWALREITLLRHFASHENITGLIDMNAIISPDYQEIRLPSTVYVRAMFTWAADTYSWTHEWLYIFP